MAIPDYQACMLPLLEILSDGQEHRFSDTVDAIADRFGLTEAERQERIPSGQQTYIANRVGWARTYLKKAELIDSPRRGLLRISERGLALLAEKPARVDTSLLMRYGSFVEFRNARSDSGGDEDGKGGTEGEDTPTPQEALERAHGEMRSSLEADLLEEVRKSSPQFFEQLVVDVLVKMGYGGSREDAGRALGRSGDGGLDGVIQEDRLGLDAIYLQAKRWEGNVGRPEIQKFAGALQGVRARKGVFITTSDFSTEARDYVRYLDIRIVLIDGKKLAELMVDHDVGVSVERSYTVKRIDFDYFTEE